MSLAERLWKYTVLGVTSIVFEEANPIGGGLWVRHGRAELAWVITAVALGTWAASIALYLVGRWRIDWVRERWPDKRDLLASALTAVERHPWRASLAVRFAWGLRLPLPIACGAARLPLSLYAIASGISCWTWAAVFAYFGYAAGGTALAALAFTRRLDVSLGLVALLLTILLFFIARRRRIGERTAEVLSGEEEMPVTTPDDGDDPEWDSARRDRDHSARSGNGR
ncbi:MAG TPA: VTT domain-containing protein [Gemmatimonadaceae bacterium]|jgi:membrane protein DedA with SNARE-associated domain